MNKITFCIPSKNNCRYLKACIPSIRKNAYRKDHDIIVFVDADEDGTVEWLESVRDKYKIEFIVNGSDELYGIGRAYDYSNSLNGNLDNIQIWNTVLSQSEIQNYLNLTYPFVAIPMIVVRFQCLKQ